MGNIFSASEIVELGIEIEKNGRDFYQTVSEKSKNNKAAGIFQYLSREEKKHIEVFRGILNKIGQYEPQGLDADEYPAYMKDLAEKCIFTRKDQGQLIALAVTSDKEAVDKGIGFEKDSIVFYEGIKKTVPDYDRKVVDELIVQEENHLKQLLDLKVTL